MGGGWKRSIVNTQYSLVWKSISKLLVNVYRHPGIVQCRMLYICFEKAMMFETFVL